MQRTTAERGEKMTKDVLVAIKGLQFDASEEEASVETINAAQYFEKNSSRYIVYDEVAEGSDEKTKNIIKFKDNVLELTKKGMVNVHMVFEENKKNMTNYATPFGDILIGIDAQRVSLAEEEEHIKVDVNYALEINYEHLADCRITMEIKPKELGTGWLS